MSIPCSKLHLLSMFKFQNIIQLNVMSEKGQSNVLTFLSYTYFPTKPNILKMNVVSRYLNSSSNRKCEILQNERLASDITYLVAMNKQTSV